MMCLSWAITNEQKPFGEAEKFSVQRKWNDLELYSVSAIHSIVQHAWHTISQVFYPLKIHKKVILFLVGLYSKICLPASLLQVFEEKMLALGSGLTNLKYKNFKKYL